MATSLLRRSLKCLQQDGGAALRGPFIAAFCTKAEEPKKTTKKVKSAIVQKERAALLVYKTVVAFPARLSASGFDSEPFSSAPAADGGSDDVQASSGRSGETTEVDVSKSIKEIGQEASSSSSSDSESDSDSDSDDEKSVENKKTEDKRDRKMMETETGVKCGEKKEEASPRAENIIDKGSEPTKKPTSVITETQELIDSAPTSSGKCSDELLHTKQAEVEIPKTAAAAAWKDVDETTPEDQKNVSEAESSLDVPLDPTSSEELPQVSKMSPESSHVTTDAPTHAARQDPGDERTVSECEEVLDGARVISSTPLEEASPASVASAPEPFDNSTYKNLQHHNYQIYTFVDMDVEMAKHRLPQPSTGRSSPRD